MLRAKKGLRGERNHHCPWSFIFLLYLPLRHCAFNLGEHPFISKGVFHLSVQKKKKKKLFFNKEGKNQSDSFCYQIHCYNSYCANLPRTVTEELLSPLNFIHSKVGIIILILQMSKTGDRFILFFRMKMHGFELGLKHRSV